MQKRMSSKTCIRISDSSELLLIINLQTWAKAHVKTHASRLLLIKVSDNLGQAQVNTDALTDHRRVMGGFANSSSAPRPSDPSALRFALHVCTTAALRSWKSREFEPTIEVLAREAP
eukprot:CAMPEP_0171545490 /NCGR_PEP_ID=MMETSP0960-20121227/4105_1 /TAXON_ID=87120 /ORGANISM="Aurantiochytrium limacinum, Strain ATCCMYA-1381" /LENGTH=116 /DNA_ID=CAMNT_0012093455 /DNA_START=216 /DNA_END=571 /DNA_ORIENTATION=-